MAKRKIPKLTPEQLELANACTRLQRDVVLNIECRGMSDVAAYRAAGGKAKTENTQASGAWEILRNPKVIAFRNSLTTQSINKAIMTREEALESLSFIGRIKMTDVCDFKNVVVGQDDDGKDVYQTTWVVKNSEDMHPDVAAAIKSVKATKNGPVIELHDSMQAKKMLAEMQGWNAASKFEHTSPDGSMSPRGKTLDDFYAETDVPAKQEP